ncbi:MAG: nucleotide exchange factor GrpE [Verrucomicrobiales bacterium]
MTNTQEHGEPDPVDIEPGEVPVTGEANPDSRESAEIPDPQTELDKWKDVAARSQADLDNFRKRMAREKSEAIQYANRSLLEQLLPIIDNFEMGLKAAASAEGDSSIILQGMSMVFKQIGDFLTDQGVEIVPSDGVVFDPNIHEALKQEHSETVPEGHVIYTMRRGYRLKERILRAATVVVSSGPGEVA